MPAQRSKERLFMFKSICSEGQNIFRVHNIANALTLPSCTPQKIGKIVEASMVVDCLKIEKAQIIRVRCESHCASERAALSASCPLQLVK
jgi:hypothetical protein